MKFYNQHIIKEIKAFQATLRGERGVVYSDLDMMFCWYNSYLMLFF